MKLSEFVTSETEALMEFASLWRKRHEQEAEKFPAELGESSWYRHYLAYCARKFEEADKSEQKAA